jgi:hypothetical protein
MTVISQYSYTNADMNSNPNSAPGYSVNGQLSIPITLSILISNSLFTVRQSPASTLIIPFYRFTFPYGYFLIFSLDLITAFIVQAVSLPLLGSRRIPPPAFPLSQANRTDQPRTNGDNPLFPKGMTINFSASAPFSAPRSKTSTLFTLELLEIKKIPGYVVGILTLLLYWFLYPAMKPLENNQNGNNSNHNGN